MTTRHIQMLYKLLMLLTLSLVVSCGTNDSQNASTGSVAAQLKWNAVEKTAAKTVASAPVGVTTVRVIISAADITTIQNDFTATSGSGTISGVLSGTDRSLTAQGLNSSGTVIYQGTVANLTVQAGQTTNAGTVIMTAVAAIPKLSFDLTSLTFGPQDNFTTSATQTVKLSNTGNTGILLYSDGITMPMFAQWIITNDSCPYQPLVFAAGASCNISISFKPSGDDQLRINYSLQQQLGYNPSPIPPNNYSGVFGVHGDSVTNPQIAVPKQTVQLNGTGVYPIGSPTVTTPTITSVSPSTGAVGKTVTITGTNFSTIPDFNLVRFNGILAITTAATSTSLTVTVPSNATTGKVSVETIDGIATSVDSFTVTVPVDTMLTFTGAVNFSDGIMTNSLMKNDVYATGPDPLPQTNNSYYLLDGKLSAIYTSMRRYVRQFSSFGGISYYNLYVDEDTLTHTTILEFYGVKGINTATYRMSGTCIVGSSTTNSCASIGINLNRSTGSIFFSNTPMFMKTSASAQISPLTLNGAMTFAPF